MKKYFLYCGQHVDINGNICTLVLNLSSYEFYTF